MTNSEEKLRGQIFDLEDDLQFARSKNTQGVHIKKDLEKNYADVTLQIASCANKMDSDRFDYRDQPKPSNGSGEYNGAGQNGNTEDPFDIDTLDDENETIQYPNLSRYALETESQNDLREFSALKPPESIASDSRSSYASSSPVCTLPNLSSDLSEDLDTETPLYNGNYMCRDERTKPQQYQPYKDQNANAKPNYIDLQMRRRSNTYATKGVRNERNEANKRSYSLVDSPVPLTPQHDATPLSNEAYLEDESAFTPDGYEYDQAVDSSPSVTGVSEQSLEDLSYDPVSTQDDSDSEFENFIEQRRDLHANEAEDGRASPYYPREQTQKPFNSNAQPYPPEEPAPRKVVMRQLKPQVQKKRQTMPPQNENYTEYVGHRPPAAPRANSRSNRQVPDPNLVLRPVASATEGQKYATTFRRRKTSNNTIAGYPPTASHQLEAERKYSNTFSTKDVLMKYNAEYSRVQGAHSAFQRYPVSHPHQGNISPEALSDDVYLNSQPYETTINSSDIMNIQHEFEPQYQHHASSRNNRRQSTVHQVYVSPQHSAVTPVNQNYYVPNYDSSPVDSGIYSLHNFVDRPQTVAAQFHYQHQDFNYDDETPDESPSVDVKELVSHLQQQITFLSSRIKRFEDRRKSSQPQELLSPHSEAPVLSPPLSFRSPSATSSGSEGGRRKKHSPPRKTSPNFNSPLPSNHSKPAVYPQPDKFRETEQRSRYNLLQTAQSPRPDSKSRLRELSRDMDRPPLHSQLSAPSIRPRFISRVTSGQSEGERSHFPPRVSPIPTTQHSLHPYTRHEASQNAFNVTRARSSMDASSHSMIPTQKKLVTRYQAPPPAPIKPTHSVSPQPRPILRTPRTQHSTESSRASDGYHYDEDSFKKKTSGVPIVAYKKREYY